MPAATRSVLINASRDQVFKVISDYERYPEFLPELKQIRVTDRQAGTAKVHYEVNVIKTIRYTLTMKEEPPRRLSWTFVEGEVMKDNKGEWILEEAGEGKTHATYTVEMALGPFVPNAIVKALVETSLPKMLDNFKRRAESI